MGTLARDTNPEIERIWIERMRKKDMSWRARRISDLSRFSRECTQHSFRSRYPNATKLEEDRWILTAYYGKANAERFIAALLETDRYD